MQLDATYLENGLIDGYYLQRELEKISTSIEGYAIIYKVRTPCLPSSRKTKSLRRPHATRCQRKRQDLGALPQLQTLKSYHDRWIPNCRKMHSLDQEAYTSSGSRASGELGGLR